MTCQRTVVIALFILILFKVPSIVAVIELTFEVPWGSRACFYERIDLEVHTGQIDFEYSVIEGGVHEIDVDVIDPDGGAHFRGVRDLSGDMSVTVKNSGEITMCFINEYSMSSKQVSFELAVHPKTAPHMAEFYKSEVATSTDRTEVYLDQIHSFQRSIMRSSFKSHRKAQALNSRVQFTAAVMTLGLLMIGILQVLVVKRFFAEKKKSSFNQQGTHCDAWGQRVVH